MRLTEEEFEELERRSRIRVSGQKQVGEARAGSDPAPEPEKKKRRGRQAESWEQSKLVWWARESAKLQDDPMKPPRVRNATVSFEWL